MNQSKTKKYFATISLQKGRELQLTNYRAVDNESLRYDGETRFPIIHAIYNSAKPEDIIEVNAIIISSSAAENDNEYVEVNYQHLVDELTVFRNMGVFKDFRINRIVTEDDESINTQLQLFTDLVSHIGDNDELHACITYGTKPTPIIMFTALNYGYKLKSNTHVENILYGRFDHVNPENSKIYDVTALFYTNSIVNRLADGRVNEPEEVIKKLLELK